MHVNLLGLAGLKAVESHKEVMTRKEIRLGRLVSSKHGRGID
jgi:hypothetical protein